MNIDNKNNDIHHLRKETHAYKRERDHFLEMCLNLQTKLDEMKSLEVKLRHDIYQLKYNNREQSEVSEKSKRNNDSNHTSETNGLENYFIHLNHLVEDIRDLLKSIALSPKVSQLPPTLISEHHIRQLLSVVHPFYIKQPVFHAEQDIRSALTNKGKELVIDMNEQKDDQPETKQLESNDQIIESQAKEISELKKEIAEMKSLFKDQEQKQDEESRNDHVKQSPKEKFTFQDISKAKQIYSIPTAQEKDTPIKKKFSDYLHPTSNVIKQSEDGFSRPHPRGPHARIVNVATRKEDHTSSAQIIDHLTEQPHKQNPTKVNLTTNQAKQESVDTRLTYDQKVKKSSANLKADTQIKASDNEITPQRQQEDKLTSNNVQETSEQNEIQELENRQKDVESDHMSSEVQIDHRKDQMVERDDSAKHPTPNRELSENDDQKVDGSSQKKSFFQSLWDKMK